MRRPTARDTKPAGPEPGAAKCEVTDADKLLAVAVEEGAAFREELLERSGGAYSAEQLAAILGCTCEAISDGRARYRLLGISGADGTFAYPKFQVTPTGILGGLQAYLEKFDDPDGWMPLILLLSPSDRLNGRSALDALLSGDVKNAVTVAAAYGQEGA